MAGFAEYESHDGIGLASLIRRREVTAAEVLEAAIARVEARNPAINAVVDRLYTRARAVAAAPLPDTPLAGVPYPVKDLGAMIAGERTTGGSRFMADVVAKVSTIVVERLERAGLPLFARTNSCEFGMSLTCEPQAFGPTLNPWDPAVIAGGSSGGASAAVAARMVPMAHASDGFGSIRVPASCCGLVGLKPSRGRNSFGPFLGERTGGNVGEHAVTLSVRDSAALLDITSGLAEGDPYTAPPPARPFLTEIGAAPGRLRIAFTTGERSGAKAEPEHLHLLAEAARTLDSLGHTVAEADPPISHEETQAIFAVLMAANAAQIVRSHPTKGRLPMEDEVERVTMATALKGEQVKGHDVFMAQARMHAMARRMGAFHRNWDVLLTPGLAQLPPRLGWLDMMMDDADEYWRRIGAFSPYTVWFNETGQPAMVLPLGTRSNGFPLSVQLVAPYGDEATLFRLAAQLEQAMPWAQRRPSGLASVG